MFAAVICAGAEDKRYKLIDKILMRQTEGAQVPMCKSLTLMPMSLPYSGAMLRKMPDRMLIYMLKKSVSEVERSGAGVLFSSEMRKMITAKERLYKAFDEFIYSGKRYMYIFMPDIVRRFASKCGVDPMRAKVCISERKAGRISEYLMRELCFDVKKLTLCTDNTAVGRELCKTFAAETGLFTDVAAANAELLRTADILLDADNGCVRIGRDLSVDGVEIDCEKIGTRVETGDVLSLVKAEDMLGLAGAYLSGKNRLTLG